MGAGTLSLKSILGAGSIGGDSVVVVVLAVVGLLVVVVGRLVVVVVGRLVVEVVVGRLVVVVVVVEGGSATGKITLCSGTSEGGGGVFLARFLRLEPVLQRKLWKA